MTVLDDTSIRVLPVEPAMIPPMLPHLWPHLEKGIAVDPNFDVDVAIELVKNGLTQVWSIWRGPHVVAAFCTTFVRSPDDPDDLAMDIHGMGGEGLTEWIQQTCEVMLEWATANKARRIIFRGRKCLARAYAPLGPIQRHEPPDAQGDYLFERTL